MTFPPAAANQVEHAMQHVAPGRFDAYEDLLRALTAGQVWMLLWQGSPGGPDAQYANMEVDGQRYAPAFTSAAQLAAGRWERGYEVHRVVDIAARLYPDRWGIWLNPHVAGGGVGIPYLDLRRLVGGLDKLPAGPVRAGEPALDDQAFWSLLHGELDRSRVVRAAHRAWVEPALGPARLVIGLRLVDDGPASLEAMRAAMARASQAAPAGLMLTSVALDDPFDPVARWMRERTRPFAGLDAPPGGR